MTYRVCYCHRWLSTSTHHSDGRETHLCHLVTHKTHIQSSPIHYCHPSFIWPCICRFLIRSAGFDKAVLANSLKKPRATLCVLEKAPLVTQLNNLNSDTILSPAWNQSTHFTNLLLPEHWCQRSAFWPRKPFPQLKEANSKCRHSKCPKLYTTLFWVKQIYARKSVNIFQIWIAKSCRNL